MRWPTRCASSTGGWHEPAPVLVAAAGRAGAVRRTADDLYLRTHERVTETVQLPPQGEAGYNPLYVLGQALRADGIEVHSRPGWSCSRWHWAGTIRWCCCRTAASCRHRRPEPCWTGWMAVAICWCARHHRPRTTPAARRALLDQLGVDSLYQRSHCQPFHVIDDPSHVEFCGGRRFTLGFAASARAERRWGNEHGLVFARLHPWPGQVSVLADMEFMRGEVDSPAARLASAAGKASDGLHDLSPRPDPLPALDPNYGKGAFWLVHASRRRRCGRACSTRAGRCGRRCCWPCWAGCGPARNASAACCRRRCWNAARCWNVRASGELLLLRPRRALYDAVRALFLHRLRLRAPVAAALDGAPRDQAIAELLKWPQGRVANALTPRHRTIPPPCASASACCSDEIPAMTEVPELPAAATPA